MERSISASSGIRRRISKKKEDTKKIKVSQLPTIQRNNFMTSASRRSDAECGGRRVRQQTNIQAPDGMAFNRRWGSARLNDIDESSEPVHCTQRLTRRNPISGNTLPMSETVAQVSIVDLSGDRNITDNRGNYDNSGKIAPLSRQAFSDEENVIDLDSLREEDIVVSAPSHGTNTHESFWQSFHQDMNIKFDINPVVPQTKGINSYKGSEIYHQVLTEHKSGKLARMNPDGTLRKVNPLRSKVSLLRLLGKLGNDTTVNAEDEEFDDGEEEMPWLDPRRVEARRRWGIIRGLLEEVIRERRNNSAWKSWRMFTHHVKQVSDLEKARQELYKKYLYPQTERRHFSDKLAIGRGVIPNIYLKGLDRRYQSYNQWR